MASSEAGKTISHYLDLHKKPTLFLISGGSCLSVIDHIDLGSIHTTLSIGVVDDRFSFDPYVSNSMQLSRSKFAQVVAMQGGIVYSAAPVAGDTLALCASRYNSHISLWKKNYPRGKIIALLGVGIDGHIAGMMPYPEDANFFNQTFLLNQQLIVGYDAGVKNKYPLRVTATFALLKQSDQVFVYACGPEKLSALGKSTNTHEKVAAVPGWGIHLCSSVHIFTDQKIG